MASQCKHETGKFLFGVQLFSFFPFHVFAWVSLFRVRILRFADVAEWCFEVQCMGECPFLGCWFGGDDGFFQIRVVDWSSANVDPLRDER